MLTGHSEITDFISAWGHLSKRKMVTQSDAPHFNAAFAYWQEHRWAALMNATYLTRDQKTIMDFFGDVDGRVEW